MIIVIRIAGMVNVPKLTQETLYRMKLRRKYSAVILEDNVENEKMLLRVRDSIAYGKLNKETLEKLKSIRGNKDKSFFRLHPPRGGIDSKKHFGVDKGVLGDNKDKINDLIVRML